MKRQLFLLSFLLILGPLLAQTWQWSLKTDGGITVPMENVAALLASADNPSVFSILLKEGDAITDVRDATVAKETAIVSASCAKGESVISTGSTLLISNLRPGTRISLYDLNGSQLTSVTANDSTYSLPLEPYAPGYYILTIADTPYKIQRTQP